MKLAASNIAWPNEADEEIYGFLKQHGFSGLEIAPTRIFPDRPYDELSQAREYRAHLKQRYGLSIPSMQSIWYGREGNIFNLKDRADLIAYTKKAVDFAQAVGAYNLVFGNPKAKIYPADMGGREVIGFAKTFFKELASYAGCQQTVIALEPTPVIYNTNFMTSTTETIEMIKKVDEQGCRLNLDLGSIIYNFSLGSEAADEMGAVELVRRALPYASHIHISEPGLKPIQKRKIHEILFREAAQCKYEGYISIEMAKTNSLDDIKSAIEYIANLAV